LPPASTCVKLYVPDPTPCTWPSGIVTVAVNAERIDAIFEMQAIGPERSRLTGQRRERAE
jgi:hypothetical protein